MSTQKNTVGIAYASPFLLIDRGAGQPNIDDPDVQESLRYLSPLNGEARRTTEPVRKSNKSKIVERMISLKNASALTARQFATFMSDFELANMRQVKEICAASNVPFTPVTHVHLSAYLGGYVSGNDYNTAFYRRMQLFYADYTANREASALGSKDNEPIGTVMNRWFKALGIDPMDSSVSPYRALATAIAPHYKRQVIAKESGKFKVISSGSDFIKYSITTPERLGVKGALKGVLIPEQVHVYEDLSAHEPLLVTHKDMVTKGEPLQYAVLMVRDKEGKLSPSVDHTMFYRWYKGLTAPTTRDQVKRIEEAVAKARK